MLRAEENKLHPLNLLWPSAVFLFNEKMKRSEKPHGTDRAILMDEGRLTPTLI